MKLLASPFYFSANPPGRQEDNFGVRSNCKMGVVTDGVSPPYVGEPFLYGNKVSGGEMASAIICHEVGRNEGPSDIRQALLDGNRAIKICHNIIGKNHVDEVVGGCCAAAYQIVETEGQVRLVVAGDCGVLCQDQQGSHFLSNFDDAAYELEGYGNEFFQQCLVAANRLGIDSGWPVYDSFFKLKQKFRANQHLGQGGHAIFNGDPAVQNCWTEKIIDLEGLEWLLLLTDGALSADFHPCDAGKVAEAFNRGGVEAILALRDDGPPLPHIKRPEATIMVVKFGE